MYMYPEGESERNIHGSHSDNMCSSLEVVEVVALWGGEEGEVVATVGHGGVEDGQAVPEEGHGEVGTHDQRSGTDGHEVDPQVLQRVAVDGDNSHGGRPLVMGLVDPLVEQSMVAQPVKWRERE